MHPSITEFPAYNANNGAPSSWQDSTSTDDESCRGLNDVDEVLSDDSDSLGTMTIDSVIVNGLPTLLSPSSQHISDSPKDSCTGKRIIYPIASALAGAALVAFKVCDIWKLESAQWTKTLLSFGIGLAVQNILQTALSHDRSNREKSLLGNYITPVFLIGAQVYANANSNISPLLNEILLSSFVALGGAATASMIHTLWTRKLTEGRDMDIPLISSDTQSYSGYLSSFKRQALWSCLWGVVGIGSTITGNRISDAGLLRDFGVLLLGDAMGQLGSELLHKSVVKYANKKGEARYIAIAKIFLACANSLPGVLIVGAGTTEKYSRIGASILYGAFGFCTGLKRHLERTRFFRSKCCELSELKHQTNSNTYRSVFHWTVSSLVAAYLIAGMCGFDFQNGTDDQYSKVNLTELLTFFVFLYGSYGVSRCANYFFKKEGNQAWKNELYFYSQYTLGAPTLALYILEKMKIGDIALARYDLLQDILSGAAYASLGMGIGQEASVQGEYPDPRIASALPFALIGKFMTRMMLGEFR